MTTGPDRRDGEEWSPATSAPGEIFTPEGQIKQYGALARGLKNEDPRLKPYRRQMWGTGLAVIGIGIAVVVLAAVLTAIF